MNFSKGYTAAFYAAIIDPETWEDIDRLEIVSGSINRTATDLRQSAELTLREYDGELDRWIRIYMDAKQGEDETRVPLFTGIATSPEETYNAGVRDVRIQCYSVLKAAADVFLQRGYYISRNRTAATAIRELLNATPAPIEITETTERLADEIIAESNESRLTMTDKVLKAASWTMKIGGDGTIYIGPEEPEPAAEFSPANDIIGTSFTQGRDWFACPNILRATSGDLTAVARDDDPDSPLSTVARGREIWADEDSVTLLDGQTIAQYARAKLKELQRRTEKISYTRRFQPALNIGDVVRINYTDIQGDYMIDSQAITLGAAGSTQETAQRTI